MYSPKLVLILLVLAFFVFLLLNTIFFIGLQAKNEKNYCGCESLAKTKFKSSDALTEVDNGELKWSVSLFSKFKNESDWIFNHICTGVVLNPSMVLTSAHCFEHRLRPIDENEYVGAGSDHNLTNIYLTEANHRKIRTVHFHPSYNFTKTADGYVVVNDLAIVELNGALRFDYNLAPACLFGKEPNQIGNDYILSGFEIEHLFPVDGRTQLNETRTQPDKEAIKLMVANLKQVSCENELRLKSNESLICCASLRSNTSRLCIGDRGINILYETKNKTYVAGVVNGVIETNLTDAGCPTFGAFTPIHRHLGWIKEQTDDIMCPNSIRFYQNEFNRFILVSGVAYFIISLLLFALLLYYLNAQHSKRTLIDFMKMKKADKSDANVKKGKDVAEKITAPRNQMMIASGK